MGMLKKFDVSQVKLNMFFSAPVFFDDGKNMFLAAGKAMKAYHLAAIKRWKIPFLLTSGHAIEQGEGSNIERMAGFDAKRMAAERRADETEEDAFLEEL